MHISTSVWSAQHPKRWSKYTTLKELQAPKNYCERFNIVSLQFWHQMNIKKRAQNKMFCDNKDNGHSWCQIRKLVTQMANVLLNGNQRFNEIMVMLMEVHNGGGGGGG